VLSDFINRISATGLGSSCKFGSTDINILNYVSAQYLPRDFQSSGGLQFSILSPDALGSVRKQAANLFLNSSFNE